MESLTGTRPRGHDTPLIMWQDTYTGIQLCGCMAAVLPCRATPCGIVREARQIVVNNELEFFKFKRRCLLKAYAKGKTTQQWAKEAAGGETINKQ